MGWHIIFCIFYSEPVRNPESAIYDRTIYTVVFSFVKFLILWFFAVQVCNCKAKVFFVKHFIESLKNCDGRVFD